MELAPGWGTEPAALRDSSSRRSVASCCSTSGVSAACSRTAAVPRGTVSSPGNRRRVVGWRAPMCGRRLGEAIAGVPPRPLSPGPSPARGRAAPQTSRQSGVGPTVVLRFGSVDRCRRRPQGWSSRGRRDAARHGMGRRCGRSVSVTLSRIVSSTAVGRIDARADGSAGPFRHRGIGGVAGGCVPGRHRRSAAAPRSGGPELKRPGARESGPRPDGGAVPRDRFVNGNWSDAGACVATRLGRFVQGGRAVPRNRFVTGEIGRGSLDGGAAAFVSSHGEAKVGPGEVRVTALAGPRRHPGPGGSAGPLHRRGRRSGRLGDVGSGSPTAEPRPEERYDVTAPTQCPGRTVRAVQPSRRHEYPSPGRTGGATPAARNRSRRGCNRARPVVRCARTPSRRPT
jgi:hypothetical protein